MLKVVGASWFQTKVSSCIILAVILLGILAVFLSQMEPKAEDGNYTATVFWSEVSGFQTEYFGQGNNLDEIPKGVARAVFRISDNGWSQLEIETQDDHPDWAQAYAAGFLEGSLCWNDIYSHWQNTIEKICEDKEDTCSKFRDAISDNIGWVEKQIASRASHDPFWHQVELFYMQILGLHKGFEEGVLRSIEEVELQYIDFIWMNIMNDMDGLQHALNLPVLSESVRNLTSVLIKYVPENTHHMYVAHNTGGKYNYMLRILKRYNFRYHRTSEPSGKVPGQEIIFSSYPGVIHSQDDFYQISNEVSKTKPFHLTVMGGPIQVHNKNIWKTIKLTSQVLSGPTVMAANRLSMHGQQWSDILKEHGSGTGNNQWLVLDYNRLRGKKHHKHVLWIVEHVPGRKHASDVTRQLLDDQYFILFGGLPYHENIAESVGTKSLRYQNDATYHEDDSPVGELLSQGQKLCSDLTCIVQLMRSNNFSEESQYSSDPLKQIAGRGDLNPDNPQPIGVIDTKIIEATHNEPLEFYVVAGPMFNTPTVDVDDENDENSSFSFNISSESIQSRIRPFQWSTSLFNDLPHEGHPDLFNFKIFKTSWVWL